MAPSFRSKLPLVPKLSLGTRGSLEAVGKAQALSACLPVWAGHRDETCAAKGMMRKEESGRHSQNYGTCVAQSAMPLHTDITLCTALFHAEMMPLRMAYRTNSAVVPSPR